VRLVLSRSAGACCRWTRAGRRLPGAVALRHPLQGQGMITWMLSGSDGGCEVVEGDAEPVMAGYVGGDVVMAAAQVLHEGVPGGEDPR
jgi:hypothetical protein